MRKYIFNFFNEKNRRPLDHSLVSILVWPKLPLRVYRFGQNSSQKVLPCRMTAIELWPLVGRVERPNSWFLAISSVETDILSTFGHSMKCLLDIATCHWIKFHYSRLLLHSWIIFSKLINIFCFVCDLVIFLSLGEESSSSNIFF